MAATFAQRVLFSAFIQGFKVDGRAFTGGSFDWFTLFSALVGDALTFGYALLCASWLIIKTSGDLQRLARRQGRWCLAGIIACVAIVSIWTRLLDHDIAARWLTWPNIAFLAPIPVVNGLIAWWTWRALERGFQAGPFLGAVLLFLMSCVGIAISLFPMIVPHHNTLWEAASAPKTQAFLLVGTVFLRPAVPLYTAWCYWVFRGKVRADIGPH